MRAVYINKKEFVKDTQLVLEGEKARHLTQVLRLKKDQEILLLNGEGLRAKSAILEIRKKEVVLNILSIEDVELGSREFSIAIGQLKKEAMDAVLRSSCELNFSKIIILETSYSQKYPVNHERAKKILISSLEQSNCAYLPKLEFLHLKDLKGLSFSGIYTFTTEINNQNLVNREKIERRNLVIIGPEGGFSDEDLEELRDLPNNKFFKLDLPIMRAPTAVSCSLGYLKAFC